jgi:predicted amidohydrolase YtcJ
MTTTLLRGGRVLTPAATGATALLTTDGTVTWVGRDPAGIAEPEHVIDLDGALVTPAFVDAHVHTTSAGLALTQLDLSGARSAGEVLDAVAAAARDTAGRPVLGHGWDQTGWPDFDALTRATLDRASYGGVVYLSRVDIHSAFVSSALVAATPGVRDEPGWADVGLLTRAAHHAVRRAIWTGLTDGQRADAQRATRRRCAELGIGAIHELAGPEISSADDLAALVALAAAEPGPEVVPYWGEVHGIDTARELGAVGVAGDVFADGSLGSRTACLSSPYDDDPGNAGHAYLDADTIAAHTAACTRAGLQAGFHAIGDLAIRNVVDGYRAAAAEVGAAAFAACRHRIEHLELIDAATAAELGALGVVASVQPVFDELWGGADQMYAERLGVARSLASNPLATLAAAGVRLAFGSDAPVTQLGPWAAVRAAVRHHQESERIPVPAAVAAHTEGAAFASTVDGGRLEPGAPASYAVWAVPAWAGDWPELSPGAPLPRCLRTVVRGRTAYEVEG